MLLNAPPITFVGGKGGVGKTTLAAATALSLAAQGRRVLVMSTDPAHSLADAFELPLAHDPTPVADGLWAAEPDGDALVRARVRQVTEDAHEAVPREIMPAVERHLAHAAAGPGMVESALADHLMTVMARVPEHYDHLVVDSAPTGHLLRLLHLPGLLTPWIQGLVRQRERAADADRLIAGGVADGAREDDPLLERLHARRQRIDAAARRLREDAEVRLVLLPRRMVLAETLRAAEDLRGGGFRLGPATINQVPRDVDPALMDEIRSHLADRPIVELPLRESEPTGLARLRDLLAESGARP